MSLGCESFNREALAANAREQGRPVETIVIQQSGGTRGAMEAGNAAVGRVRAAAGAQGERAPQTLSELVLGILCAGGGRGIGSHLDSFPDRHATHLDAVYLIIAVQATQLKK